MRHVIQREDGRFLVANPIHVQWDANVERAYVAANEDEAEELVTIHMVKTSCRAIPLRDAKAVA